MISAEQNHAGPNRDALFNGIARNFYWPVKTFPTSRFGTGAFDSRFYGSLLRCQAAVAKNKTFLCVVIKKKMTQVWNPGGRTQTTAVDEARKTGRNF